MNEVIMHDAVVIGGGLSGLSCAVALADHGLRVIVLERDTLLGGRARSWTDVETGDTVDIGPHILQSEYRNMLAFLERLGTRELITWQPDKLLTLATRPKTTPLYHAPLPPPMSLIPSVLKAPGLSMRDYLSMMPTGWRGMQFGEEEVPALDAISALDFLREHGVTERMVDWWWRFAAMVVTNVPLERCSMASLLRIHAQLSGHRGLHFGFAAVGLGELYARQATDVIEKAGGRVLTGSMVHSLIGRERAEGVRLADGHELRARWCVSALPPQDLAPLLPAAWKALAPFDTLDSFEPSPYISCYLWFDRVVTTERFVSHLWSPTRMNYDFYDLSKIRRGWEARPSVIATNIIYSHRAHALGDDDIVRITLQELAEFAPDAKDAQLLHADVHRIPMAIPCPTVGFERKRPQPRTPVPGLLLAGDWLQTHLPCTMESAVASGQMAAEQLLLETGRGRSLALSPRPYDGIAGMVRRATRWWRARKGMRPD